LSFSIRLAAAVVDAVLANHAMMSAWLVGGDY